jgi:hypothetical protein
MSVRPPWRVIDNDEEHRDEEHDNDDRAPSDAVEFLKQLRPAGPWVLIAIVPDSDTITTQTCTDENQVRAFVSQHNVNRNIYFSVNPTRAAMSSKASKSDIAAIEYIFGDLDPDDSEAPDAAKERYSATLEGYGVKPTLLIDSGNGLQPLWRFDPKLPTDDTTIAAIEARCKALMQHLGSKSGTQNIDRILRLPGTINLPNKKKQTKGRVACETRLLAFNDISYGFEAFLPISERLKNLIRGIDHPDHPYDSRSERVFAVLVAMVGTGCSDSEMEIVMRGSIGDHIRDQAKPKEYLARQIKQAREKVESDASSTSQTIEPTPLFPPLPEAEPYPLKALGGVLARGAEAIARKIQVPDAIAAQSVLAAAALVSQAHADVMMPYNQTRPLSLFFITIAASGDRKTSADNEALWPIRKHEANLSEIYRNEYDRWRIEHDAWVAEKRKIESNKKFDLAVRKQRLSDLGAMPPPPLFPFLTTAEPTIEGLVKNWVNTMPALGIFSAEGGQFIGGVGMNQDNRLKTSAMYSEIWDGLPINRVRATDGVTILLGRRLSSHLMVQPDASTRFLGDKQLRDQGILSRFLGSQPKSLAGTRNWREPESDDEAAIRAYGERLLSLLEKPLPLALGTRNVLAPPALVIAQDAEQAWIEFYNAVETACGENGELGGIKDFAAKAAEHAARIAGVLTIINDFNASEIDAGAMGNAIVLASWYVNETLRLQRHGRTDSKLLLAQDLLEWMWKQPKSEFGFRFILQFGPAPLRTKTEAEGAIAILKAHGWVRVVLPRPYRIAVTAKPKEET